MEKVNAKVRQKKILKTFRYHFFAILLSIVMIYPLVWMLFSSFKANDEIFSTATSIWPKTWDVIHNYTNGWEGVGGVGFGVFMLNSFVVTVIGTAFGLLSSLLAAYAFARVKFKGSGFWFACVMVTMMVPSQVMSIPQYIIFKKLNLIDTRLAMIVPWMFGGAFFVFLFLQFIRGIPVELDEAAEIDGCGKLRTLFSIILPNVVPACVTAAIFSFYWSWQDFFHPLIFMNSVEKFPVALGLRMFLDPESASEYGSMLAMSVVSLIPVLTIFVIFQRHLVEGTATSGLKG